VGRVALDSDSIIPNIITVIVVVILQDVFSYNRHYVYKFDYYYHYAGSTEPEGKKELS